MLWRHSPDMSPLFIMSLKKAIVDKSTMIKYCNIYFTIIVFKYYNLDALFF